MAHGEMYTHKMTNTQKIESDILMKFKNLASQEKAKLGLNGDAEYGFNHIMFLLENFINRDVLKNERLLDSGLTERINPKGEWQSYSNIKNEFV